MEDTLLQVNAPSSARKLKVAVGLMVSCLAVVGIASIANPRTTTFAEQHTSAVASLEVGTSGFKTIQALMDSPSFSSVLSRTVPILSSASHKGSSGRIAILGGSEKYTGAPYYAAMGALRTGLDLATVYCAEEASIPIKTYSPELMVDSVYKATSMQDAFNTSRSKTVVQNMVTEATAMMDSLHAVVIGNGLGRNPMVMQAAAEIIKEAARKRLNIVLDADALYLLSLPEHRDVIAVLTGQSSGSVILTPNVVEYRRLVDGLAGGSDSGLKEVLPGVVVVKKGPTDVIEYFPRKGEKGVTMVCEEKGGLKRSGGLGDTLAGITGAFVAWNLILSRSGEEVDLTSSAWLASCITRRATRIAYDKRKRSMTAPDVLEEIGGVVDEVAASTIKPDL